MSRKLNTSPFAAFAAAIEAFIASRAQVRDAKNADPIGPFVALASAFGKGADTQLIGWLEGEDSPLAKLEPRDRVRTEVIRAAKLGDTAAILAAHAATLGSEDSGLAVKPAGAFRFLVDRAVQGDKPDAAVEKARERFAPTPEQVEKHNAVVAMRDKLQVAVQDWLANPDPRFTMTAKPDAILAMITKLCEALPSAKL